MGDITIHTGTLSKDSPIIKQGQILAKVENGELIFCKVYHPFPLTGFRKSLNYPKDMYFLPGEEVPEFKFVKVEVDQDQTSSLIDALNSEDPETGSTYAERYQVDTSGSIESVLSQIPSDVFLEVDGATTSEVEDPYITKIFSALQTLKTPIEDQTIPAKATGLEDYKGVSVLELILLLFKDRDSSLPDYYLEQFAFEPSLETNLRTALNKPKANSKGSK